MPFGALHNRAMPLIFKKNVGESLLVLWKITESEDELRSLVSKSDIVGAETMQSVARRCERLAWRALLRQFLPDAVIEYNAVGAPVLTSHNNVFISVSHSSSVAALAISSRPCAVDIESVKRDVSRVSRRYTNETEIALSDSSNAIFYTAVWCAKETLYKLSGQKGLNIQHDLTVIDCNLQQGRLIGQILNNTPVSLCVEMVDDNVVVYKID